MTFMTSDGGGHADGIAAEAVDATVREARGGGHLFARKFSSVAACDEALARAVANVGVT